jgi:hypothetical protein
LTGSNSSRLPLGPLPLPLFATSPSKSNAARCSA